MAASFPDERAQWVPNITDVTAHRQAISEHQGHRRSKKHPERGNINRFCKKELRARRAPEKSLWIQVISSLYSDATFSFPGSWQSTHSTKREIKPRRRTSWDLKPKRGAGRIPRMAAQGPAGQPVYNLPDHVRRPAGRTLPRNQNDRFLSVPGYTGCWKSTQAGGILNTESARNKADRSLTSGCRKGQELSHTVSACTLLSDGSNEN